MICEEPYEATIRSWLAGDPESRRIEIVMIGDEDDKGAFDARANFDPGWDHNIEEIAAANGDSVTDALAFMASHLGEGHTCDECSREKEVGS